MIQKMYFSWLCRWKREVQDMRSYCARKIVISQDVFIGDLLQKEKYVAWLEWEVIESPKHSGYKGRDVVFYTKLDEKICITRPKGLDEEIKKNLICNLSKSLYHLKLTSECWYRWINSFILSLNFIDDVLVVDFKNNATTAWKTQFEWDCNTKELRAVRQILVITILRDTGYMKVRLT